MLLSILLWIVIGTVFLTLGMRFLYERYLHPAWRRQRRIIAACEKAFTEGTYRLERLRVSLDDPSIADLFPSLPFGSRESTRSFTYKIETLGGTKPDFSGMRKQEIDFVRHYLYRTREVPHHGNEVLRPSGTPVNERSKARV